MSWNSTFIVINRDFSNRLDNLQADLGIVLGKPLHSVSWEEATSSMATGKSVGIGRDWTIICDPFMFLDAGKSESHAPNKMWLPTIEKGLEVCSTNNKVLGFIMSGVSGTYGMTIYDDGKLVRCRLVQEGESVIDIGKPSPEEIDAFTEESDEEQRVFAIMEKFNFPFEKLENMQFTLYESAV